MALTRNGRRIGMAAHVEAQQMRRDLERQIAQSFKRKFDLAIERLARIDPDWETWYDDDRNIPAVIDWCDHAQMTEVLNRIEERIKQAYKPEAVRRAEEAVKEAERTYLAACDRNEDKPSLENQAEVYRLFDELRLADKAYSDAHSFWMAYEDQKAADWADEQAMYQDLRHGG